MGTAPRTLEELWRTATAERRPGPAYLVRCGSDWVARSWEDVAREVEELAAGLLELGIRRGDRVAILGRTRVEWALCDWAAIAIGAPVVPIYPTGSALECAYILGNSGARFVICEDEEQLAKVEPARRELEALEQVIVFDGLAELRARGAAHLAAFPSAVTRARDRIAEDDVVTIAYTSGTTGPPKGCVLTQRNYRAMVEMVQAVGLARPDDVIVLHLPLAHTFGRLISFLGAATGATIAFCPDVAGIVDALATVRPTLLPSVPRLYEKLAAAIMSSLEDAVGVRGRVARRGLEVGRRTAERRREGRRLGPLLAVEHVLADRLVLERIRARLGGNLRFAISGGAPLARELAEFFHAFGIVVLEGYGLTESTTAATFNRPGRFRLGTVGPALPGVELKLASDGEVLVRGENVFRGYYRDEEATRQVLLEEGWLATGDIGALDADGFLTITDRKKDIIVTAGGKNVSPQNLESGLKASRYVSEAVVVGDRRPFLTALLVVDRDAAGRVAADDAELRRLIDDEIAEANRDRAGYEQIRRYAILPRELSQEESELTPTLKVRRHVCEEHFAELIDQLYAGAA